MGCGDGVAIGLGFDTVGADELAAGVEKTKTIR
jgi:hypothetical protein